MPAKYLVVLVALLQGRKLLFRVDKTKEGNASFELVCERAIDTSSEGPIDVGGFSIDSTMAAVGAGECFY